MEDPVARKLIEALYAATPVPSGCRVNHARGILVEGRFVPSPEASRLSSAEPFAGADQPLLLRFSSSTGDIGIAQDDPHASPRGLAVRIGASSKLVLVGHSTGGFPASDGEGFLDFIQTAAEGAAHPELMERYLDRHAAARGFTSASTAPTTSFASLTYHMLHPYRLTSPEGVQAIGRLRIEPRQNSGPAMTGHGPDYLDDELRSRLEVGVIPMILLFQPAPDGVDVTDVTLPWPEEDDTVVLGRILVERVADDQVAQTRLTFDPAIVPNGVAFAGDAMIETRLAAYQLAFDRRVTPVA